MSNQTSPEGKPCQAASSRQVANNRTPEIVNNGKASEGGAKGRRQEITRLAARSVVV